MATIGQSSAPSQNTINYDALLTTTMNAYDKTLYDNIFKDSAFLSALKLHDAWKSQNGGERMQLPLMYGKNKTIKTGGGYETIDTTPQEGFTSAFYEWAEIAGSISISRLEKRKNSGEGQIIDLMEGKVKQAELTMREELNGQLLLGEVSGGTFVPETSTGGNLGLLPLGYFMRKDNTADPTTGGNVGNISGSSNDWWRPHTAVADSGTTDPGNSFALSVTTYKGLTAALRRMYNYCSRGGGGSPNLVVCDQITFETYENAMDDKVRYTNTKLGELGFDTVRLRGADVVWDEVVPDIDSGTAAITKGTAFFLNTNFYQVKYDAETNIVTTPFVEPENQTVSTAKILFMGQAGVSNFRKHGVLYGISQSIVA